MSTLQAVGLSLAPQSTGSAPAGRGILQTQLARYEVQLADWCHCPSGKTADGKAKIADLQQKADAAKAQIKRIDDARAESTTAAKPVASQTAKSVDSGSSTVGSRLDVYA